MTRARQILDSWRVASRVGCESDGVRLSPLGLDVRLSAHTGSRRPKSSSRSPNPHHGSLPRPDEGARARTVASPRAIAIARSPSSDAHPPEKLPPPGSRALTPDISLVPSIQALTGNRPYYKRREGPYSVYDVTPDGQRVYRNADVAELAETPSADATPSPTSSSTPSRRTATVPPWASARSFAPTSSRVSRSSP